MQIVPANDLMRFAGLSSCCVRRIQLRWGRWVVCGRSNAACWAARQRIMERYAQSDGRMDAACRIRCQQLPRVALLMNSCIVSLVRLTRSEGFKCFSGVARARVCC